MELLESHLAVDKFPTQGGSPFTIVVTIGLDQLLSGIGAAALDTGSASAPARRGGSPSRAGLIPMVLDGTPCRSTSGVSVGCSPRHSASRWRTGTAAVRRSTATGRPRGPRPTTSTRGTRAAGPTCGADPALPAAPPHGRPPGLVEHEADAPRRGPVQQAPRQRPAARQPVHSRNARSAPCQQRGNRAAATTTLRRATADQLVRSRTGQPGDRRASGTAVGSSRPTSRSAGRCGWTGTGWSGPTRPSTRRASRASPPRSRP